MPADAPERNLVYLDNAATTQKPEAVIGALSNYYRSFNANVHRALHTLGEEATAAYEMAARTCQRFHRCGEREREMVFTRGATESINLVARASWGRENPKEGDVILLTEMEHHSNLVPWQLIAEEKRAQAPRSFLSSTTVRSIWTQLDRLWNDRMRLVSLVHMSNVFGTVNDVKRVAAYAHERGVPVLVDAAQSVPHMRIDVKRDRAAIFSPSPAHKMYAPMGIGVLYAKEAFLRQMPPFMGGGDMIRSVRFESSV